MATDVSSSTEQHDEQYRHASPNHISDMSDTIMMLTRSTESTASPNLDDNPCSGSTACVQLFTSLECSQESEELRIFLRRGGYDFQEVDLTVLPDYHMNLMQRFGGGTFSIPGMMLRDQWFTAATAITSSSSAAAVVTNPTSWEPTREFDQAWIDACVQVAEERSSVHHQKTNYRYENHNHDNYHQDSLNYGDNHAHPVFTSAPTGITVSKRTPIAAPAQTATTPDDEEQRINYGSWLLNHHHPHGNSPYKIKK